AQEVCSACLVGTTAVSRREAGPPLSGTFRSAVTGRVVQLFAKDDRQMTSIDGTELPLATCPDGGLSVDPDRSPAPQTIVVQGARGGLRSVRLIEFGCADEMIALPEGAGGVATIAG